MGYPRTAIPLNVVQRTHAQALAEIFIRRIKEECYTGETASKVLYIVTALEKEFIHNDVDTTPIDRPGMRNLGGR